MKKKTDFFIFEKITSTSDLINNNSFFKKELLFVIARQQTKGRGAGDNSWISEYGKNLLLSFFLKHNTPGQQLFDISRAVSVAIIDLLKSFEIDALIKWPNDILANRKKIAGILIENKISQSHTETSVGIGLNINQISFPNLPATSMKLIKNKDFDIMHVFFKLKQFLIKNLSNLENINFYYEKLLFGKDQRMRFKANNEIFEGIITGTDKYGRLKILTDTGQRVFFQKEIIFLP